MKNILNKALAIAILFTISWTVQAQKPSANAEHFKLPSSKVDFVLGKEKNKAKFDKTKFNYFDLNDKKEATNGYFVIDVSGNKNYKSKDSKAEFTVSKMKFEKGTNGAYYGDINIKLNGTNKTFKHELLTFNPKEKTATFIIAFKKKDFNLSDDGSFSAMIRL